MKKQTEVFIKMRLDDAAGYAKQAKTAVQYSDREAFVAYIGGARAALWIAEKYFMEGMENE